MADRPILFSAPMVRALLAGTKTQTRRVVKPQLNGTAEGYTPKVYWPARDTHMTSALTDPAYVQCEKPGDYDGQICCGPRVRCPNGQPGDRLWVRESFWLDRDGVAYKADQQGGSPWLEAGAHKAMRVGANGTPYVANWGWRPSIHMPRWASRITLEVTGVRVERLQDISEADAMAEGVDMNQYIDMPYSPSMPHVTVTMKPRTGREAYAALWEQINGPESWATNPWVWVVEFRRLETAA